MKQVKWMFYGSGKMRRLDGGKRANQPQPEQPTQAEQTYDTLKHKLKPI